MRIAAVGDIHVGLSDHGKWQKFFTLISEKADVLIICGDLTDTGHVEEASVLSEELKFCKVPVVAVLGNHDFEQDQQTLIKNKLSSNNVHILDGESFVLDKFGFAGVKGYCGGFDNHMMPKFGEKGIKTFVQEAVDEAIKLDRALAHLERIDPELKKIVVLHYAPIKETIHGEPEQIFPFLGSTYLENPINNRNVLAAFHGHAHMGVLQSKTGKGIPVFNVAVPILLKAGFEVPFYVFEVQ